MCLLIVWLNPEKKEELDAEETGKYFPLHEYALILANNRDERFDRPSLPAQFLARPDVDSEDVLAGWDNTPGKETGTWLGLSLKRAKIGALVNIPEPDPQGTKGRGSLVTDFLLSPHSADEYCQHRGLSGDGAAEYPGFQLITLERERPKNATGAENAASAVSAAASDHAKAAPSGDPLGNWRLHYASNRGASFSAATNRRRHRRPDDFEAFFEDVFVFSNAPVHAPLLKVAHVEARFRQEILHATHASVAAAAHVQATHGDRRRHEYRGDDDDDDDDDYRFFGSAKGRARVKGKGKGFREWSDSTAGLKSSNRPRENAAAATTTTSLPVTSVADVTVPTTFSSEGVVDEPSGAADSSAAEVADDRESALFEALFRLLSCRREYDRDRELAARVHADLYKGEEKATLSDAQVVKQLSAVFNVTPVFGTRTQTVLLVKWDGSAVWKERTMKEPIDISHPAWEERTYRLRFA